MSVNENELRFVEKWKLLKRTNFAISELQLLIDYLTKPTYVELHIRKKCVEYLTLEKKLGHPSERIGDLLAVYCKSTVKQPHITAIVKKDTINHLRDLLYALKKKEPETDSIKQLESSISSLSLQDDFSQFFTVCMDPPNVLNDSLRKALLLAKANMWSADQQPFRVKISGDLPEDDFKQKLEIAMKDNGFDKDSILLFLNALKYEQGKIENYRMDVGRLVTPACTCVGPAVRSALFPD